VTVDSPDTTDVPARHRINHIQLAVLTALLGGMLAAGSYLGPVGLLVAIAVVQAVLVPSAVLGTGLPGRIGAILLGVLAAAGADITMTHWHTSGYSPVLGVLGVAIPVMFFHQLTRGVVRTRVVESLAGITVLLIAVTAITGLIVLRQQGNGRTVTLALIGAITAGLVAAHFADAVLPAPRFDPGIDRGLPAVLAGLIVGGGAGLLGLRNIVDFAGGRAVFVGAAVAAVACLLSIGATFAESRTSIAVAADDDADEAAETGDPLPVREVSPRLARLRPAAAAGLTLALTVPAAYVLTNALTS
jgi:hypothetical protein